MRQARSEKRKKLFQILSRQEAKEIPVASMARWEEHLRMLIVLERECLDLTEANEHLSEKQEVLAVLMEGKMSLLKVAPEKFHEKIFHDLKELEEQKTKEAMELLGTSAQVGEIGKMKGTEQGCYKEWSCQGSKVVFPGPFAQFLHWFWLALLGT